MKKEREKGKERKEEKEEAKVVVYSLFGISNTQNWDVKFFVRITNN